MYPRIINQFIDNYHSLWRAATCSRRQGGIWYRRRRRLQEVDPGLCLNAPLWTVLIHVTRVLDCTSCHFLGTLPLSLLSEVYYLAVVHLSE